MVNNVNPRYYILLLIFACIILTGYDADAQCAMCKAVVESNQKDGGGVGAGLNKGILYLMSLPYILVFLGGLYWYYTKKKLAEQ